MAIFQERRILGRLINKKELAPGKKVFLRLNTGLTLYDLGTELLFVESDRTVKLTIAASFYQEGFNAFLSGENINTTGIESNGALSHFGIKKKIIFQKE